MVDAMTAEEEAGGGGGGGGGGEGGGQEEGQPAWLAELSLSAAQVRDSLIAL